MSGHIDIVFDGPPGPTAGRFVEVEDDSGKSISFGEWIERDDGYWALRIEDPTLADMIKFGSIIAHLLEFFDTGEAMDLGTAMSSLHLSGLPAFAEENAVLLPMRRDSKAQHVRMLEEI